MMLKMVVTDRRWPLPRSLLVQLLEKLRMKVAASAIYVYGTELTPFFSALLFL